LLDEDPSPLDQLAHRDESRLRNVLILDRAAVELLLPMDACIEAVRQAHLAFSAGQAVMPVRLTATFGDTGLLRAMPAWLDDGPALGMKSITNFPGHKPPILATMLLYNPGTGELLALMDGVHLTNVRTAAASAVATQALARVESSRLALVGAGVQAGAHLEAMAHVLPLERVTVTSRTPESAERFVAEQAPRYPQLELLAADTLPEADVVCTVSSAREPVVTALEPGTHVNAVGSHAPTIREIAGEVMRDARVVVDSREATLSECGDCLLPIASGLFGPEHVSDELGEVLAGTKPGRSSADEITIYQSCGIAVQDVAAARLVYDRARSRGIGIEVNL
jgi:ornithine cyclodeaminase/alanine dehydrogenase-like protein (mu-crystallin family)